MRYVAIAFVFLAIPLLCALLRQGRRERLWCYLLIGLLPFTINAWQLDAGLINWGAWPGYAKGAVMTVLDSLAIAILLTHRKQRGTLPLLLWMGLYASTALLSVWQSGSPMASAFYAFQLLRIIVLMAAVGRIASDREAMRWLAFGLSAGISYQAFITLTQKAEGAIQASGTMGHPNLLGLMNHFVLLPLLAFLLAGERSWILKLGIAASLTVMALGASRGSITFAAAGTALLIALSLIRRVTPHKWRVLGFAVAALAIAGPVTYLTLEKRFQSYEVQSGGGEERAAFERAAKAMWADHPLGAGANMYVIVANKQGYSARAGVNWNYASRNTNVHNIYLLAGAETGWPGFLALVALLSVSVFAGWRYAFRDRRDPTGEIALGWTCAIIATAVHSLYEWVLITYQAQYMLAIGFGVIGGLIRERRKTMRGARRARRTWLADPHATPGDRSPAHAGTLPSR